MATAIFIMSDGYCGRFKSQSLWQCSTDKMILGGSLLFDIIVSLGCLIAGILGACSVIGLGSVASFSLIGVCGVITLAWIAMVINLRKKDSYQPLQ